MVGGDQFAIFVYSSRHNHELCYAVSDRPDGGFTYGGTLVDLGDLYMAEEAVKANMQGLTASESALRIENTEEVHASNYLGNTHGGILKIEEQWYIFCHRHTNRHGYSRQACAERLIRTEDGRYDCSGSKKVFKDHPYFTQTGKDRTNDEDQYIANMRDGAAAGFKYFLFESADEIKITVSGNGKGIILVSDRSDFTNIVSEIPVSPANKKSDYIGTLLIGKGIKALYFRYQGEDSIDFHSFEFGKRKAFL